MQLNSFDVCNLRATALIVRDILLDAKCFDLAAARLQLPIRCSMRYFYGVGLAKLVQFFCIFLIDDIQISVV